MDRPSLKISQTFSMCGLRHGLQRKLERRNKWIKDSKWKAHGGMENLMDCGR
jgi:hypothetical protein